MGEVVQLRNNNVSNVVMNWLDQFKSERTVIGYKYAVECFFGCNANDISDWKIKGVKFGNVQEYIKGLFDSGKSDNTVKIRKAALSSLFEYCIDRELIIENPCDHRRIRNLFKVNSKKGKEIKGKSISKDAIKLLLNKIDNKFEVLLIGIMFKTGVRVSELIEIKHEDIEIRNENYWLKVIGKGRRVRYIPVKEELVKEIEEYIGECGIGKDERLFKIGVRQVERLLKKWIDLSCHDCRRSFAINYIKNGGVLTDLQRILGHSKIETTRKYLIEYEMFDNNMIDVIDW
jgi:integrase/recombinase XerD